MTDKLPESRIKANKRWNENNKERMRYLRSRSSARSFINNRATIDDIKELQELLTNRKNKIKDDSKMNKFNNYKDYRKSALEGTSELVANMGDYTLFKVQKDSNKKIILRAVYNENTSKWKNSILENLSIDKNDIEPFREAIIKYNKACQNYSTDDEIADYKNKILEVLNK